MDFRFPTCKKWLYIFLVTFVNLLSASSSSTDKRYHEMCFLTSHNSYAAWQSGYLYAQQNWNIQNQLAAGIRGLMLDTYDFDNKVLVYHKNKLLTEVISLDRDPVLLVEELQDVRDFLLRNPTEIITIILENYVQDAELLDSAFIEAGLSTYILKPNDWDPVANSGWPYLSWLQANNKRLVIFNSLGATEYTYNEWQHVIENQYGTLVPSQACTERKESQAYDGYVRYLYLTNFFPTFKMNFCDAYEPINTEQFAAYMVYLKRGLGGGQCCKDRVPNFIALDFVDEGFGMKWVNFINKKANLKINRQNMFKLPVCVAIAQRDDKIKNKQSPKPKKIVRNQRGK